MVFEIVNMGSTVNNQPADTALDNSVKTFIQEYNIPGVVLSVKLPGHVTKTFATGVANIYTGKSMTPSTLFPIGSITKSFTSAAILELVDQHKLTLQTTLSEIASKHPGRLSKLIKNYPQLQGITILELLNHTSGLPDALTTEAYENKFKSTPLKHWDSKSLIRLALQQNILFHPGTPGKFHYSNTDYILAQMVYNTISTTPISKAIDSLLTKVGVTDYFYPSNEHSLVPMSITNQISQGYMPENPYWPSNLMNVFRKYPKVYIKNGKQSELAYNVTPIDISQSFIAPAAGGIIMSVPDIVKWYDALFINKTILPNNALIKMLTGVPTHDGYKYGLGITKRYINKYNVEVYSHTGSNFGFNTNVVYIKDHGIVIAAAINAQKDLLRFNKGLIPGVLKILKTYGYLT